MNQTQLEKCDICGRIAQSVVKTVSQGLQLQPLCGCEFYSSYDS